MHIDGTIDGTIERKLEGVVAHGVHAPAAGTHLFRDPASHFRDPASSLSHLLAQNTLLHALRVDPVTSSNKHNINHGNEYILR